ALEFEGEGPVLEPEAERERPRRGLEGAPFQAAADLPRISGAPPTETGITRAAPTVPPCGDDGIEPRREDGTDPASELEGEVDIEVDGVPLTTSLQGPVPRHAPLDAEDARGVPAQAPADERGALGPREVLTEGADRHGVVVGERPRHRAVELAREEAACKADGEGTREGVRRADLDPDDPAGVIDGIPDVEGVR